MAIREGLIVAVIIASSPGIFATVSGVSSGIWNELSSRSMRTPDDSNQENRSEFEADSNQDSTDNTEIDKESE